MKNSGQIKAFFFQILKSSFLSPLFYFISAINLVVVSALFFFKGGFFSGNGTVELVNFWANVPYAAIICIPALCAKKSSSAFDDFVPLGTSVKIILQIVACSILFLCASLFLLVVPLFVSFFGDVDGASVFVPLVFLYFYGLLCATLCVLAYSITKNLVSGFALSAVVLAVFNSAHLVSVYWSSSSLFSQILKSLSFAWHFDAASKGIFDTRDFVFLLFGTSIFFGLDLLIIEKRKGKKLRESLFMIFPFLVILLLFMNGNRYYKRTDFSSSKAYSAGDYTKNLVKNISSPLKISYYLSPELKSFYPQVRDVKDYLDEYCLLNNLISLEVIDPSKDAKYENALNSWGIYPQSFRSVNKSTTEYISVYSAVILEYEGKITAIPFILSSETLEYLLDSNLLMIIRETVPTVHFVCADLGETLEDDYSYIQPWLLNQNIQSDEIILDANFSEVLETISGPIFVLGGNSLSKKQCESLSKYMAEKKGSVTVAWSPILANITGDWNLSYKENPYLLSLLSDYGMGFVSAVANDISCVRILMYSDDQGETSQSINYPMWVTLPPQTFASQGLNQFWTVPLELYENAEPYLVTTNSAWKEAFDFESDLIVDTNPFTVSGLGKDRERGNLVTAAVSKDRNLTLISGKYFLNTLMNGYAGGENGDYRNFEWLTYHVLCENGLSELAELQQKTTVNKTLYKINNGEEFNRMKNITLIFVFAVIPLLLAALYLIFSFYSRFARSQALKRL